MMSNPASTARRAASRCQRRMSRMSSRSILRVWPGWKTPLSVCGRLRLRQDYQAHDAPVAQAQRRQAGGKVHHHAPAKPQLDPRQGAVFMDGIRHQPMGANVAIIPQGGKGEGVVIRCRMHRTVFGVDHTPTAFGLDAPHRRKHLRAPPPHTGAVGHLIETIRGGDRADAQRLEQYVMSWITHLYLPILPENYLSAQLSLESSTLPA